MIQKLVLAAILLFFIFLSRLFTSDVSMLTTLKSLGIVLGGTVLGVLLAFPVSTIMDLFRSVKKIFGKDMNTPVHMIQDVVHLARVGRLKGVKALESECEKLGDPFLRIGVELVVDQYGRHDIRDILEKEFEFFASRLESQQAVLNTMVKLAPAFGFVGTIVGLINVLGNMSTPAETGTAMSLALLTTFYGLLASNVLFLPLSKKFSEYVKSEQSVMGIMIEGLVGIAEQENSKGINHRLNYYVHRQQSSNEPMDSTLRVREYLSNLASSKRKDA
ncbi:MAG: MotA/TolQ/ExbB proton channel family protein [Deltaproteobacteria bacterium]|nr:MotA/TolQ/ExbB proton channel family protein [Deltaproteobacteria bacterium]